MPDDRSKPFGRPSPERVAQQERIFRDWLAGRDADDPLAYSDPEEAPWLPRRCRADGYESDDDA